MPILKKLLLHLVLPVLIIAGGLGLTVQLVQSRPAPERTPPSNPGLLVQTQAAERTAHRFDVEARGTVIAARQVQLQPQVVGRVVWKHPELELGGFVNEGEPLVRIESRDYEIIVEEAKTVVAQAQAQLAIEEGQQLIARREWALFADQAQRGEEDPGLALRGPQLQMAESTLEAARARQRRAELDLSRTTLRAPFSGIIQGANLEVGQLVNAQTSMATLVGTDAIWINTSVPLDRLGAINVPGARATVRQDLGATVVEREGRVVRLLGDLDPVARMARILVEVEDPFERSPEARTAGQIPLLVGAFVEVIIEGKSDRELIALPRGALHDGTRVYVVSSESTLEIRAVDIAWRTRETVLVEAGLQPGDQIITSAISAPMEGMKLRVAGGRDE